MYPGERITKETHQVAELEGDLDLGMLSLKEVGGSATSESPRRRDKEKRPKKPEPRRKRQLRILSLGRLCLSYYWI
jgi:hypothetical protein